MTIRNVIDTTRGNAQLMIRPEESSNDYYSSGAIGDAKVVAGNANQRATSEFALGFVRANGVIRFQIVPSDGSVGFDTTKTCLAELAHDIGMAAEFVSNVHGLDGADR
jgi:hypothetical protein